MAGPRASKIARKVRVKKGVNADPKRFKGTRSEKIAKEYPHAEKYAGKGTKRKKTPAEQAAYDKKHSDLATKRLIKSWKKADRAKAKAKKKR